MITIHTSGKWHLGIHKEKFGDFKHHPLNQGFDSFYGLTGTNLDDFDPTEKVVLKAMPFWYWQFMTIWSVTAVSLFCLFKFKYYGPLTFIVLLLLWSVPVLYWYLLFDNYILLTSFLHRNYDLVEQPIRLPGLCQRLMYEGLEFMQNATYAKQPFMLVMSWVHMHVAIRTAKDFTGRSQLGRYGDALEELDWSIGEILKSIKTLGIENNTIVYFTSDNGGHLEIAEGGYNGVLKGINFCLYLFIAYIPFGSDFIL